MNKRTFVAMFSAVAIVAGIFVSCNSSNQSPDLPEQNSLIEGPVAEGDSHATAITSKNSFDEIIANNEKCVLVDFWASWCGPCRMIAPNVEAIADEMQDKIVVAKVDVDLPFATESGILQQYGIESIPCLILFHNGEAISRSVGYKEKEELKTWLDNNIK